MLSKLLSLSGLQTSHLKRKGLEEATSAPWAFISISSRSKGEGPSLSAFSSRVVYMLHVPCMCSIFILSTEYSQFHINFFHCNFLNLMVFPRVKDIWQNKQQEGSRPFSQIPMWAEQNHTCPAVSATRGHWGGAIGPVPTAQLVTPGQALQLPWQPLHCAPWRPQVTTADATTSRHTPLSPPQHALTQQHRSHTPAISHQIRSRLKVDASWELLSP